jgi:hypothetical protein
MSTEPREPVHGEMFCEHCDNYVLLCSHGCGIDWHKLCLEAEQKLAVAVEALDRIVNGAPYVTYYERYMDDGTIIPTYGEVAEKALALIKPDAQKKENANGK